VGLSIKNPSTSDSIVAFRSSLKIFSRSTSTSPSVSTLELESPAFAFSESNILRDIFALFPTLRDLQRIFTRPEPDQSPVHDSPLLQRNLFSVAIPLGRAISRVQRSTVELTSGLALTHPSFLAFTANSQNHSANAASRSEPPAANYAFTTSTLTSVANQLCIPVQRCGAIIDSGASSHFCPDRAKFKNYVPIEPQDIQTVDGTTISAVGRGNVMLDLPLGSD
jgi:hypothetical protein